MGTDLSSLDNTKRNRNTRCGRFTGLGRILRDKVWTYRYVRLGCKSWQCPHCGPRKAARIQRRITEIAKEYALRRFLTLTLDPKKIRGDKARYVRQVWAKFRTYVKREFDTNLTYVAVLEETKKGVPHLHVLIDRYLPQEWISDTWSSLGGGKIVHIEVIKHLEAIGSYVAKYLSKDLIRTVAKGTRRITTSRDIRLAEIVEEKWILLTQPIEEVLEAMPGAVAKVEADDDGTVSAFESDDLVHPFLETGFLEADGIDPLRQPVCARIERS